MFLFRSEEVLSISPGGPLSNINTNPRCSFAQLLWRRVITLRGLGTLSAFRARIGFLAGDLECMCGFNHVVAFGFDSAVGEPGGDIEQSQKILWGFLQSF